VASPHRAHRRTEFGLVAEGQGIKEPKLSENGARTKEYLAHLDSMIAEGDSDMATELDDALICLHQF